MLIMWGATKTRKPTLTGCHHGYLFKKNPYKFLPVGAVAWLAPVSHVIMLLLFCIKQIMHIKKAISLKACTDIPCNWNQGTKKDVQPKIVCDIKLAKNVCKKHEH